VAELLAKCRCFGKFGSSRLDVNYMDGLPVEHSATGDQSTTYRNKRRGSNWAVVGDESQTVLV